MTPATTSCDVEYMHGVGRVATAHVCCCTLHVVNAVSVVTNAASVLWLMGTVVALLVG
jgi:hypothetical protein